MKAVNTLNQNNNNFQKPIGQKVAFGFYSLFQFWRLFLKNFFSTFEGGFYGVLLPIFLVSVVYLLFKNQVQGHEYFLVQGLVLLPAASFGISFLPQRLANWKRSVFFKRLDASPVSKSFFMISLISFYSIVIVIAVMIILFWAWCMLLFSHGLHGTNGANTIYNQINYGYFFLGIIFMAGLCIAIGLFIAGLVSEEGTAQAFAFLVFLPLVFVTGMMFPPSFLDQSEAMRIITYFLPTKYPIFINLMAWSGGPGTVPPVSSWTFALEFPHFWIPIVGSAAWLFLFFLLSRFTFKYTSRTGK